MADTYKILGQKVTDDYVATIIDNGVTTASTKVESLIYQVPTNTQASISSIQVLNSGSAANYDLSFVKQADVASSSSTVNTTTTTTSGSVVDRLTVIAGNGFPSTSRYGYSDDNGLTWTYGYDASLSVLNGAPTPVLGVGGVWITANTTSILSSTNGLSWTEASYSSLGLSVSFNSSTINVSLANNQIFITNPETSAYIVGNAGMGWVQGTFNANSTFGATTVVFDPNASQYVATGYARRVYKSNFSTTGWNQQTQTFGISMGDYLGSMAYGNGVYWATQQSGGTRYKFRSYDAVTWSEISAEPAGIINIVFVNY
jgi:hypothetical protein